MPRPSTSSDPAAAAARTSSSAPTATTVPSAMATALAHGLAGSSVRTRAPTMTRLPLTPARTGGMPGDVLAGEPLGRVGVGAGDGVDDLLVLLCPCRWAGRLLRLRLVDGNADAGHPQHLGEAGQVRVAGGRHQRQVEAAVGGEAAVAVAGLTLGVDRALHGRDRALVVTLGRQPCGARLERHPSRPGVAHVAEVELRHGGAAVGLERDQPFGRQPPQRLAKRRPRHAQLLRQRCLSQLRAARQVAGQDPLAERGVDVVDHALDLQRAGRTGGRWDAHALCIHYAVGHHGQADGLASHRSAILPE